ncbi:hypothetical protein KJQ97_09465, partial [Campylobacter sp. 2018MI01]
GQDQALEGPGIKLLHIISCWIRVDLKEGASIPAGCEIYSMKPVCLAKIAGFRGITPHQARLLPHRKM